MLLISTTTSQKNEVFKQFFCKYNFFVNVNIVIRNRQSGNTGRLNRNLCVMLKFTERPKTPGMT